jgi:hypothetical protein
MHRPAASRVGIRGIREAADPFANPTELGGGSSTGRIPPSLAAEGVDRADGFAARAVVAVGGLVLMAAATGPRVATGEAESVRLENTRFIPGPFAADRIDPADDLAAVSVLAVRVLMRHEAGARRRFAALVGQLDRLIDAGLVPFQRAAVLESADGANRGANRSVVAGRRGVRFEAALGNGSAERAELPCDCDANLIPRDIAAEGFGRADDPAAFRIVTSGSQQVGDEAALGCIFTASLGPSGTLCEAARGAHPDKEQELARGQESHGITLYRRRRRRQKDVESGCLDKSRLTRVQAACVVERNPNGCSSRDG